MRIYYIYICDACGTEEALLKFMSNPLPITEWACFRPAQAPSDFKTLTAEAIWERVHDTKIPFLTNLYERWQEEHAYEDFSEYRAAAFESCPGLTQLWERPFRAEYAADNGKLVLRFRLTDEGIYLRLLDNGYYLPLLQIMDTNGKEVLCRDLPEVFDLSFLGEIQLSSKRIIIKPRKNAFTKDLTPITFELPYFPDKK